VSTHHEASRPHAKAPQRRGTGQLKPGRSALTNPQTPNPEPAEQSADQPHPNPRCHGLEPLLSPSEVAQTCNVSRKTIYRAIERSELRACKIGNRLRIKQGDYQDWLEHNTVSGKDATDMTTKTKPVPSARRIRDLLDMERS
jgi:excisionase family DNA binding protein